MAKPRIAAAVKESPAKPEPSRFLDPADDSTLLGYFRDVSNWHGFIRFLGLPHLKENPDQPLHELYIEPFLSRTPIHPDRPPAEWISTVEPALAAVAEARRLIVLGDPGSGKSTLVSWIAWQLSQPRENPWRQRLGPLVPFPMILRELKLDASITWKRLLEAFLTHPVTEKLKSTQRVEDLMERGQAFFLLDGLDEIGSLEVRKTLREAVFEGARKYPACKFLLTSRVVGYEEVSFEEDHGAFVWADSEGGSGYVPPWGERRYVAPFSDEQIQQFARNWYSRREAVEVLRATGVSDLVAAIHGSESTLRLARNPNLLTLMALVHRVQRRLPHGRALLFEKIAEAYLESIDTFRGLQEVDYPLTQKKRWLGYVGFQMQLQRSKAAEEEKNENQEREVLVDHETVCRWIHEAMESSAHGANPEAARKFVDYIGRRSGLLLPRGEGLFAFTHLSFQEYFAAYYLSEQVVSPRWRSGKVPPGARPKDLRKHANQTVWREPLILLFELLADRREWLEELSKQIFGEEFKDLSNEENRQARAVRSAQARKDLLVEALNPYSHFSQRARAALLAEISVDPYSGFTQRERISAWEVCWRCELRAQQGDIGFLMIIFEPVVAQRLLAAQREHLPGVLDTFRRILNELRPTKLSLKSTLVADLSLLSGLVNLQMLFLSGTSISDLSPLSGLVNLQTLFLNGTSISDLSPLSGLVNLQTLDLSDTSVSNLSPLSNLVNLQLLGLSGASVSDLLPLLGLMNLRSLFLDGTSVSDLSPLSGLVNLQTLNLNGTSVSDLSPLSGLVNLQALFLAGVSVSDPSALSGLVRLRHLRLDGVSVSGLEELLASLPLLEVLPLSVEKP